MKKKLLVPLFLAGMAIPAIALRSEIKGVDAAFIGEFGERTAYIAHASKINAQLAEEGFALLKNDGTFPIEKGSKVTLVGKASVDLVRGGGGSGAINGISSGVTAYDFPKSLTDAGLDLNTTATNFYKNAAGGRTNGNDGWKGNSEVTIGETPIANVKANSALLDSFEEYNDLAIQVISREGSEGCDILTIDATDSTKFGASNKHALELSDNEQALFDELHNYFDKILIVVNSSNIFECEQFENDDSVAGVIWVGNPGDVGPVALGRILVGDVNPSGHTVDTWTRDFTKDPTFQNFSDNRHTTGVEIPNHKGRQNHQSADTMFNADGTPMKSYGTKKSYNDVNNPKYLEAAQYKVMDGGINGVKPASFVSYEEGIYMDYRYHETRYADMAKEDKAAADAWYNSNEGVLYPFGYGLSYTTFSQEVVRVNPLANSLLTKDTDIIEVSVKVTNTGDVAGKDVVQLYWKAPYTPGGIEKADHVLCAFDKTNIIEPGESQIVHLTFHLQDVTNYDYKDANENGHVGYELDDGDYAIMVMKNAHEAYCDEVPLKVQDGGVIYETDRFTGHEVTNRFTDRGFYSSMPGEDDIEFTEMSRADFEGTFPTAPTFESRKVKAGSRYQEFLTHEYDLAAFEEGRDFEYTPEGAHRTAEDGANWQQTGQHTIKLIDMKDCEPDDPKWDEFINEFSWNELMTYVENNKMSSPSMSSIGKSGASEGDGPQKFNIMAWVSSPIIAATYNPRLAHEQGECIGMESQISGKSGWWGCAVNTHRSPFGGRNFEYYSADPFLMGRMAAQVVGAATDRGVFAYFKHFAVNDQEKNRESGISFVNEQALREIYLKSFQMVFEEGKSIGVMGSYNRLGLLETAASYPLMTEVLRGEWGFKGSVLSDMTHSGNNEVNFKCYECVTWRVLAGCNCQLDSGGFSGQTQDFAKWSSTANGGKGAPVCTGGQKQIAWSFWNACREAVKQHMYMCVNSTLAQRGLTQVVGQKDAEIYVGQDFRFDVQDDLTEAGIVEEEIVNVYDSSNNKKAKTIASFDSYEVNKRCDLPAGVTFEDGILSGKFANVQLARIDIIINVTFDDNTTGKIAYKYVLDAIPVLGEVPPTKHPVTCVNCGETSEVEDGVDTCPKCGKSLTVKEVKQPEKKCNMSVVAASAFVSVLTIAGAALLLLKRKEN